MATKKRKTNKRVDRRILAVFSDTHAGDKYGLLNPKATRVVEVPVDQDGGTGTKLVEWPVDPNPFQAWLWGVYEKNIKKTMDLADGDDVMVVHNGDLTQGWKYPSEMLDDMGSQMLLGTANMMPWFEFPNVKWFKLIWGTASHIFGNGSSPRIIHRILKQSYPKVDVSLSKHSILDFGGVVFDVAHHGPGGGIRNWTRGNVARYYLTSLILDYLEDGKDPPDVVIRSHYHVKVEESITKFNKSGRVRSTIVVTPSYQGLNEYSRQVTKSVGKSVNGHVAFEIINGKLHDIHWHDDTRDVREMEVIK